MPASPTEPTTFAEFGAWYEEYLLIALEPGLQQAIDAIERLLSATLSERDQVRIHRVTGRVKTKQRAWRKLGVLAVGAPLPPTGGIPEVVQDLVGVRVTCTNLRDIEMVQEALETLPSKARASAKPKSPLWLTRSRERDYVLEPKESGYRGWHVGIGVMVDIDGQAVPVACELQVRTLLQDTWGELTHVDTYSKDAPLPPLVSVLSSRMADLLATMDDIAEDLRTELDRVDEEAVTAERVPSRAPNVVVSADVAGAEELIQTRWQGLEQPLDLASLAWELRQTYGPEVSDEWFGSGSFKRLVRQAVPDAEFSTGRQQFLLPAETPDADDAATGDADEGEETRETGETEPDDHDAVSSVPIAAQKLRAIDKSLPLLEADQWPRLFASLAAVWPQEPTTGLSARDINRLSKRARDQSDVVGQPMARRHFDYVVKAVSAGDDEASLPDAQGLPEAFSSVILERMRSLRVLGENNRKGRRVVREWLGGAEDLEATR